MPTHVLHGPYPTFGSVLRTRSVELAADGGEILDRISPPGLTYLRFLFLASPWARHDGLGRLDRSRPARFRSSAGQFPPAKPTRVSCGWCSTCRRRKPWCARPNQPFYQKKRSEGCRHVQRVDVFWDLLRDNSAFASKPPCAATWPEGGYGTGSGLDFLIETPCSRRALNTCMFTRGLPDVCRDLS